MTEIRHNILCVNNSRWAEVVECGVDDWLLSDERADELAIRLDLHPACVWPEWTAFESPGQMSLFDLFEECV